MGKLIYSAIASADGYAEDATGRFGWAAPGEELLCFVNDLERPAGTYLYGRRMYQTLPSVPGARTRIERDFDPGMVRDLKAATGHDMTVGGADLAGQALKAGLVDELQLFLVPVIVGGGQQALPTGTRPDLELLDTRRFANGAVYLRYRLKPA